MTDRNELKRLQQKARKAGRVCTFFFDESGNLDCVYYNEKIRTPLVFAEMEREKL